MSELPSIVFKIGIIIALIIILSLPRIVRRTIKMFRAKKYLLKEQYERAIS